MNNFIKLIYHLRKAGAVILLLLIPVLAPGGDNTGSLHIRLNPECKIKRMSNGVVVTSSVNEEGVVEKHEFNDFIADLLMSAYRKQNPDYIIENFSKKYALSKDECRREIKHALNVLSEWNIVER